ncbi:tautomerase family protein [Aquabacter sp. CN5-332]|uniref:tautomerase family protein n=1 Tax=Aquabacter sp. CN5-332 TaxID=3156608 RepID=UPI0032B5799D
MPLVRIDISKDASPELIRAVSDAIYDAMVEIANVPAHDRFQIVTRHAADELIYPAEGYLGLSYTREIVFIQVTWVAGRTTEVKKAFYKKVAEDISRHGRIRAEDVFISLVDSSREDWSFGGGVMQYAPATS